RIGRGHGQVRDRRPGAILADLHLELLDPAAVRLVPALLEEHAVEVAGRIELVPHPGLGGPRAGAGPVLAPGAGRADGRSIAVANDLDARPALARPCRHGRARAGQLLAARRE